MTLLGFHTSVLICKKLNFIPVVYMLKRFKKRNLKRINLVNQLVIWKNKLRRQTLWGKKMPKNDKLLEREDHIYVPGNILKYSSTFRCMLCRFNYWLF